MKIICIGRNYVQHAKEMNAEVPSEPLFFLKPDTALLKENQFYYPNFTSDLHYEVELVLKITKHGKHIALEHAHHYFEKVGLGIDFTARDIQSICKAKGLPWEKAKAFDHSAILSQKFIDLSQFEDTIEFSLEKNGTMVQKGSTRHLLFSFEELISYISQFITLKAGDLIYTGTPEGVGPVQRGDQLKGYIGDQQMFKIDIR
ncbi:MAG: fumarylacetoacetate hydrolase family protein [Crocinitomicaceae bacterium]